MLKYPAIGNRYKVTIDNLCIVNLIDLLCSICMPVNINSNIVSYFEELAALITKRSVLLFTSCELNKDNGMLWSCMCSLIEILWVLEEKISLNCWQVQHDVPVTEIFEFNLHVNSLYFLWNWVKLLGIFTTCEKLRAFERNPSLWSSYLMSWRWIV